MRAILQRVTEASVSVNDDQIGAITHGWLVFLGVENGDTDKDLRYLVDKILNLRAFADDQGRMNLSLLDTKGELLAISQFTLMADMRKGRRPNFSNAAPPEEAEEMYKAFIEAVSSAGVSVAQGEFGAHMKIQLLNDGPVTFILESPKE